MSTLFKFFPTSDTQTLADKRQVRVTCSAETVDRDGEIIVQAGIDWSNFMVSGAGPVLWNHNPNMPIGKCIDIRLANGRLTGLVQFPDQGDDPEADRYYAKIKFGSVSGISIGFIPRRWEPLDKGNRGGPKRYDACELVEFSFVPIPANPSGIVTGKSRGVGDQAERQRQKRLREVEVLKLAGTPEHRTARQIRLDEVAMLKSEGDRRDRDIKTLEAAELEAKRRRRAAELRYWGRAVW